jgi:hypothetical protein
MFTCCTNLTKISVAFGCICHCLDDLLLRVLVLNVKCDNLTRITFSVDGSGDDTELQTKMVLILVGGWIVVTASGCFTSCFWCHIEGKVTFLFVHSSRDCDIKIPALLEELLRVKNETEFPPLGIQWKLQYQKIRISTDTKTYYWIAIELVS